MEKLGIQPVLLIAQLVNFGIIVFLLNKLLYKPILSLLEKRRKEAIEAATVGERMKQEEEKAGKAREKMMETAKKDIQAMMEKARKDAKEEANSITENAQKQAQNYLQKKRIEAEDEIKTAEKAMYANSVDIAVLMAEKVLPDLLSEKDQKKILEKKLRTLEHMKLNV
jgi:F-type H+-transporting ATPase subunit b